MKIHKSDLQRALTELRALRPKDPQVSASEAATELAPVVRDLCKNGYSVDDIAQHLAKLGVSLSASALKRAGGTARKRGGKHSALVSTQDSSDGGPHSGNT